METADRILAELEKKSGETVRVVRRRWGRYDCLDVRAFVPSLAGHRPTTRGLCLQAAHWARLLPALQRGIEEAIADGRKGAREAVAEEVLGDHT